MDSCVASAPVCQIASLCVFDPSHNFWIVAQPVLFVVVGPYGPHYFRILWGTFLVRKGDKTTMNLGVRDSWLNLVAQMGPFWMQLAPFGSKGALLDPVLVPFGAQVGSIWVQVAPFVAQVGFFWGPSGRPCNHESRGVRFMVQSGGPSRSLLGAICSF